MKLKYAVLDKLLSLTNKEIDFLMFIARYQDDYGHIIGIFYLDVCTAMGMSKQTFYNTLRSLADKGIITYSHSDQTHDFDITILNNDFSYPESFKEGYVDVARKIFHTSQFMQLKAKEKILLLLFLKITHENSSSYQIGTKKFYDKYMDLMGVTKRVLRGYLHSLKQFFSIGIKNGKYFITFLASVFKPRLEQREQREQHHGHVVEVSCRRSKMKVADQDTEQINATAKLIVQYRNEAKETGENIFDLLDQSIQKSVRGIKDGYLRVKSVHYHLRKALGIEKRPTLDGDSSVF